jgi:hypothetical protein
MKKLQGNSQWLGLGLIGLFLLSARSSLFLLSGEKTPSVFSLTETNLTIPQVDYEGAIFYRKDDPYPHLDFTKVRKDRIVAKKHKAILMENEHIRLTLLPEMGRVYSLIFKPTGHDVFWHNDIVTVGAGNNSPGWWIWIGGAEYTLPGDEHGTTWAEVWKSSVIEDSRTKKAVRMSVTEQGTGLQETIDVALYPDRSFYEARIRISNPTSKVVQYAHWINPQWAPGGRNELTDNTEFIIPTERILIPERFRESLGQSPQDWSSSRLRFIKGWDREWGDLMADGLRHGFYSAYSHDEDEGVVRVFDKDKNPGVDIWTYGFHPRPPGEIPMGSGAENKGYVEMWGGTSKLYPDERHPLRPGEAIEWTEWMFPYHRTGGLTYATEDVAIHLARERDRRKVTLGICPSRTMEGVRCLLEVNDKILFDGLISIAPDRPLRRTFIDLTSGRAFRLALEFQGRTIVDAVLDVPFAP